MSSIKSMPSSHNTVLNNTTLYLASASPRRSELLTQIGVDFITRPANIDETRFEGESPLDFVQRMAREKAQATYDALCESGEITALERSIAVLGSDTIVVDLTQSPQAKDAVMGKPESEAHGADMLKRLSGKTHEVISAVCVLAASGDQAEYFCDLGRAEVTFSPLDDAMIQTYWQTGEPLGKAGGYAIQGLGASFVEGLSGSYSAVVGLPLFETTRLLQQAKVAIWAR